MAPLSLQQQFPTYGVFKTALADWAVAANFSTRIKKSQAECVVAGCAVKNCPFHIRAIFSAKLDCVVIIVLRGDHNCVGAARIPVAAESRQSWIQRILPETIGVHKDTTPCQIIEAIQLHWHKTINY